MTTAILWLRNDLRLTDNASLRAASGHSRLLPLFILEEGDNAPRRGGASDWWLHQSLSQLAAELKDRNSRLYLRKGPAPEVLAELARETGATHVYWSRRYEPGPAAADRDAEKTLERAGITVETFAGQLLFEPGEIRRRDGGPLRVFTPFWKACLNAGLPDTTAAPPAQLPPAPKASGLKLADLDLLPRVPWHQGLEKTWTVGEHAALRRLSSFAEDAVGEYPQRRDRPDEEGTSRLAPHLHFGEIGPRQVLAGLMSHAHPEKAGKGMESYIRQLGWREFAHHLLAQYPQTESEPLNPRFSAFPWRSDYSDDLRRWQQGNTGIPLVDAGMRQLWQTGWMHNRVRMVVASFLTKNLLIPWQEGAAWFHDTLVDADMANNIMGWQWVAGSGADAAPYFRIFNPVLQGEKFDPEGIYVKRWVPELAEIPTRHIHKPWTAPPDIRRLTVASEYPEPMVDLKETRERALAAYRRLAG